MLNIILVLLKYIYPIKSFTHSIREFHQFYHTRIPQTGNIVVTFFDRPSISHDNFEARPFILALLVIHGARTVRFCVLMVEFDMQGEDDDKLLELICVFAHPESRVVYSIQ